MSLLRQDGLVIKTGETGNSDRICTIITRDNGVIRAFASGAKNIKNKNHAASSQFVYSNFILFKGKNSYSINEADIKENFSLKLDTLEKLSLAQYFAELCITLAADNAGDEGFLRLVLNSLNFLITEKYPPAHIKAVTEMRMMCMAGYMPNIVACSECGCYEAEKMYFFPKNGIILCKQCAGKFISDAIALSPGALLAMRHICYSDFDKIFGFSVSDNSLSGLCKACERFVLTQTERKYKTLDFYNTVK